MIRVEPGIYKHFKRGDLYIVHRVLRNATNAAGYHAMVQYEALDKSKNCHPNDDGVEADVGHYARAIEEFTEVVEWPDGTRRPRWEKVP